MLTSSGKRTMRRIDEYFINKHHVLGKKKKKEKSLLGCNFRFALARLDELVVYV